MNKEQMDRIQAGKGFIAALDQSGGSTPKALLQYGIQEDRYSNEEEMFHLMHGMRKRMITSSAFTSKHILGAILFENTMDRTIQHLFTADYLWEEKGIVPFLKVDRGLAAVENGVQLMKSIPDLDNSIKRAVERHIFGTKMRSVIKDANYKGISKAVEQQFEIGKRIIAAGLVPIIEPEVDIHSPNKEESEKILKHEISDQLSGLKQNEKVILKLSIPTKHNFFFDFVKNPHVVRVLALSGGYTQMEACEKLSWNQGVIASFSRALSQGLTVQQADEEFNLTLGSSIKAIYTASIT